MIARRDRRSLETATAVYRDRRGAKVSAPLPQPLQMTAPERLAALFQEGTLEEIGIHIRSSHQQGVAQQREFAAVGVVVGTGYVDGRAVAAISQDFTAAAGTLGKLHVEKIVCAMQTAAHTGRPIVGFNDSGGARIREAVDALSAARRHSGASMR